MKRFLPALPLLVACNTAGTPAGSDGASGSSGSDSAGTTGATTGVVATSDPASTSGDPSATSFSEDSTTTDDALDSTCGFLCEEPSSNPAFECSTWTQNCPPGEKCMPWANDGGAAWNATRCVPVVDVPRDIDEPCTVQETAASGLDDCDIGAMCWDVEAKTLQGTCVPTCTGSMNYPSCTDPNRVCITGADGFVNRCLSLCDPLDPAACPAGSGCYPANGGPICAADVSGDAGGPLEPCESSNGCDSGHLCDDDGACLEPGNCCLPLCDLGAPQCPPDTVCEPFSDAIGFKGLGRCKAPG